MSFEDVSQEYKSRIFGVVSNEILATVEKHGNCQELSRYIEKANELFCLIGGYEQILLLRSRDLPSVGEDQQVLWLSMVDELSRRIIEDWEIVFKSQDPPRSIIGTRELIERYVLENEITLREDINFTCDERIQIIPRINCEE